MRCLITVVKSAVPPLGEKGQSILEFVLLLPILLGLSVVLVRVNTVIQASIVNQKYSRAQVLFLTFNSPHYPQKENGIKGALRDDGIHQLSVGVAETAPPSGDAEDPGNKYKPDAPSFRVNRTRNAKGGTSPPEPGADPDETANVLVRNTVTLCTEVLGIKGQDGVLPISQLNESVKAVDLAGNFCRGL